MRIFSWNPSRPLSLKTHCPCDRHQLPSLSRRLEQKRRMHRIKYCASSTTSHYIQKWKSGRSMPEIRHQAVIFASDVTQYLPKQWSALGGRPQAAKEEGMTLPKPDYIWTISRSIRRYRKSNLLSDDGKEALEAVSTLHSPYLLLEAKSNGGSEQRLKRARAERARHSSALCFVFAISCSSSA